MYNCLSLPTQNGFVFLKKSFAKKFQVEAKGEAKADPDNFLISNHMDTYKFGFIRTLVRTTKVGR
jgi:hypothetical protein